VALRGQIVDFVGLHLLNDVHQAGRVCHIAVVQNEVAILFVWILIQMVNTIGIEQRSAALDTVNIVTLVQEKLGEISAILAGDTGNQSTFCHIETPVGCRELYLLRPGQTMSEQGRSDRQNSHRQPKAGLQHHPAQLEWECDRDGRVYSPVLGAISGSP
jgi:hypothetical protein